jgi:hypothetical protein
MSRIDGSSRLQTHGIPNQDKDGIADWHLEHFIGDDIVERPILCHFLKR